MSAIKRANLCWGQRYHWLRYQRLPAGARFDAHIMANVALPEPVPVPALQSALDYLIRRHEALRTVYDADACPWPQQRVQPPGRLPLLLVSTESDGTPAPADVVAELSAADFDMTAEWPIRACAVTTGGLAKRLVVVLNHVAFDDWSLDAFRQEFEAVLAAVLHRRRAALAPVAHQPADLARAEGSLDSTAALKYWRAQLAAAPADLFARRRTSGQPVSATSASLTSPGLLGNARKLAERHRLWPSVVQLAAYAVTMAAYSGERVVTFRWLTSHRQGAEQRAVMSCMFSPALVTVDLSDDPGFVEVLRRIGAQVAAAQDNGYVPYDEIVELQAAESFRRGQVLRVESELNFLSYPSRSCGARRDRFTPNPTPTAWAEAGSDVYVRIQEWSDGVTLGLHALSSVLTAESVEPFLRGWARLIELHQDDAVNLTVSQAAELLALDGTSKRAVVHVGADAVDLEQTQAVLSRCPGVVSVALSVVDRSLLARVGADQPLDPDRLRTFFLERLYEQPALRCPDHFEIDYVGDPAAGSTSVRTDGSAAAQALAGVIAEVNGLAAVRLSDCYVSAGGRVLRAPKVTRELANLGWGGLALDELSTARPLSALATALTPLP